MTAFTDMLEDIFESEIGVDAIYTPPVGGTPVAVRVVPSQEDDIASFGQARIQSERAVFDIPRAALLNPMAGGTLEVGGISYTLKGPPRCEDPQRLVWTLECVPTPA